MTAFDIREPSIEALKSAPVYFRYTNNRRRVLVDALTASAILAVHAACSPEQQSKIARLVAGTPAQLSRMADIALRMTTLRSA